MRDLFRTRRMWRKQSELKDSYDVVIIGGGSHGLAPAMNVTEHATFPIMGALYHPPGGIIRHDAVVWGFARGADRAGVEIHPYTEVQGLERTNGRIDAVKTNRGTIKAGQVLSCTAGWSTLIGDMAGVPLPITTHILQACVTEPVKPLLDVVIVSSQMHVYISQSDRGEFVMGSEIEPWTTYRMQGTLNFLQDLTRHTLELFPQLEHARLLRSWAGLCDLSPDYSPILGRTEVENFHISAGWGTYGFKAAPIVGKTLAEVVHTGVTPAPIAPSALERFYEDRLVSELAAAAVSH